MEQVMKTKVEQKLDVGGFELYYEYFGEENENPTVVFDSGYGWALENWDPIKEEVAKFAKVFMYDRAGVGKSEKDERPCHSKQAVENLHMLLKKANVKPPYVLVGHSFGGLNVRLYASTYPKEVAGVILLDSCHEDQNKVMAPLFSKEVQEAYFNQFGAEGSFQEVEESLEQVRASELLSNIPLLVMTGTSQPHHTSESMSAWIGFHKELAKLSTKSKHIIVEEAGHAIHVDCPQTVIHAIQDMLDMIKS
ncbi:alpha/beta fold hydrolase [Bacillus sp. C1]